jgi:hypothetical protein
MDGDADDGSTNPAEAKQLDVVGDEQRFVGYLSSFSTGP